MGNIRNRVKLRKPVPVASLLYGPRMLDHEKGNHTLPEDKDKNFVGSCKRRMDLRTISSRHIENSEDSPTSVAPKRILGSRRVKVVRI